MISTSVRTTSGPDLDVEGSDAELLAAGGDVLGSQHSGVGGGLVTVGLDLHTTGNTGDGLTAAGITQNVSLRVFRKCVSSTCVLRRHPLQSIPASVLLIL